MDLIKLVKGMANAHEPINDNFEMLAIESGSNENGDYIIFPNGFAICSFEGIPESTTHTAGSVYRSEAREWTYPVEFVTKPTGFAQADATTRWSTFRPLLGSMQFRQYSHQSESNQIPTIFQAFGWIK